MKVLKGLIYFATFDTISDTLNFFVVSLKNDPQVYELIHQNSVFAKLNKEELDLLMEIAERKNYPQNQQVFSIDQKARFFYLVETGSFILSLRGRKFKTFKPGDIFGEIAIINENVRTGSIRALEESSLIAFNGNKLYDEAYISPSIALRITRALAKKVTFYLRSREQISTNELIAAGENEYVEFKSSLRWNSQKEYKDKLVEYAVLKAIAGFINTQGGTILIGVSDDKEILGIGQDRFENLDKVLLHLTQLVKDRISALHLEFLKFEIEQIDNKNVLRIDCEPGTVPAYVKDRSDETFYVRTGPSTSNLRVSKIYDYIRMRFY